ncbi:hypothetical protein [Kitasatospora sp. MAP5-34]|uniref:hypothetical protein n=1 Tax=Kitasatospora sp. MAP5-34 TaxID=3035102 RepID=UPI0024746BD8|nr:hypothetical protein [Kitasatospora sp. MAP5-34]MDH6575169.1 hypothetical protein [Kitasatospora sp. MAP5-34]
MRQRGIMMRSGVVGVGGVFLLTFLTACGGDPSAGSADRLATPGAGLGQAAPVTPSSGSGPGAIAPTEGPVGAMGRVVLMAYQSWWDAQTAAFGQSDSDGSQLRALSTGLALSQTLASLHQLHEAKLVMIGAPRNAPVVKTLDLTTDPQTSVIEDCLDVTDWHQADAVTKTPKDPPQRLTRYTATVSLRKSDGRWMIVDFKREVGRTC